MLQNKTNQSASYSILGKFAVELDERENVLVLASTENLFNLKDEDPQEFFDDLVLVVTDENNIKNIEVKVEDRSFKDRKAKARAKGYNKTAKLLLDNIVVAYTHQKEETLNLLDGKYKPSAVFKWKNLKPKPSFLDKYLNKK